MSAFPPKRQVLAPQRHILLIEDNQPDAMLSQMVHDEVKHCSSLHTVEDGDAAVSYLHEAKNRPDIIFLDLSLPRKSGLEVLTDLRSVPGCELIPVVVFSATGNPADVRKAYAQGANSVVKKPSDLSEFYRVLESCYEYWCSVVELPTPE